MPVQYKICTARYNYTRRDGTTNARTLHSQNGTKIGTVHDLACTVPPCCRLVVHGEKSIFVKHDLYAWEINLNLLITDFARKNILLFSESKKVIMYTSLTTLPPTPFLLTN